MSVERYWQLIEAGYKPEQMVTCPRGDPCWCEVSIANGGGYVKDCGMAKTPDNFPVEP